MQWLRVSSATILSFALIAAFGLHSVELKHEHSPVSHTHQHQSGSPDFDIDEYLHGTEQKFFLVILLSLLAFGLFALQKPRVTETQLPVTNISYSYFRNDFSYREINYLKQLFRKGILNPKLH